MQRGEHRGEIALRFHPEYPLEMRLQGPPARFLDRGLVHAGGEIIPDLPLRGAPPGAALRQDIENSPEETLVLARELAVYAPARLVGRDRVVPDPSAAGVAVEVDAGIGRLVHRAHVEAGRVGKRGERRLRRESGAGRAQEREEKPMRPGVHQILARSSGLRHIGSPSLIPKAS